MMKMRNGKCHKRPVQAIVGRTVDRLQEVRSIIVGALREHSVSCLRDSDKRRCTALQESQKVPIPARKPMALPVRSIFINKATSF